MFMIKKAVLIALIIIGKIIALPAIVLLEGMERLSALRNLMSYMAKRFRGKTWCINSAPSGRIAG